MPPKALSGSQASALRQASTKVAAMATPQGLACLTIPTAGSANSATSANAASVSLRLLHDSSLPLSWTAAATPGRAVAGQIERGRLMRVLAVAQALLRLAAPARAARATRRRPAEPAGDGGVIGGGVRERLRGQPPPQRQLGTARLASIAASSSA